MYFTITNCRKYCIAGYFEGAKFCGILAEALGRISYFRDCQLEIESLELVGNKNRKK